MIAVIIVGKTRIIILEILSTLTRIWGSFCSAATSTPAARICSTWFWWRQRNKSFVIIAIGRYWNVRWWYSV